jgi:photosystem II stability/assembly factor-like uncharacterized protein
VLVYELFELWLPVAGHGLRFYLLIRMRARIGMQSFTRRRREKFKVRWGPAEEPVRRPTLMVMRRLFLLLGLLTVTYGSTSAQWTVENSGSTADLRGIDNVGSGIAWASGTNGTVLRTEDGGYLWQPCTVPPGAEHLDFRGIQAFDADTAIVMSSGKGDLSRLYKTTDGCQTWKLVFTNPDKDGFWDAIYRASDQKLYVLGDPVQGNFAVFQSEDAGESWLAAGESGRDAHPNDGAFAASNSALTSFGPNLTFGTGGSALAHVYTTGVKCSPPPGHPNGPAVTNCTVEWRNVEVPIASGSPSSGIFSLAARPFVANNGLQTAIVVAVGGTYDRPDDASRTAATSRDGGTNWIASTAPPHGFRSAVAYDADLKTWITVGPNGTDVSTDDGRNWRAVHPDAALHEAPDADRNWNALSLPFVVGPHGRIGRLDAPALSPRALAPANTVK